jgi:energy-coupling factor transporter ATP-binding protein EcfA2
MAAAEPMVVVDDLHIVYRVYGAGGDRGTAATALLRIMGRKTRGSIREVHAIRGMSFVAYRGDAVGIIGRNGSGKSTLLRAIAGLLPPEQGNVFSTGEAALLGVNAALLDDLTGERNVVVGTASGGNIGTGTRNIYVGENVHGIANEARFIRIGDTGFSDYDCFIAGIKGRSVSAATASLVVVDGNGKLGTVLVNADGNTLTPKGPDLSPDVPESKKQGMLNLKVEELQATVDQQQNEIKSLTAQLKEQAAQIQKVSAQLETSRPAPKVVANK